MEAYVGTIMLWPCNWVPQGWLACSGQTLSISGNQALFSLIGAAYGGDGSSNFQLPNLNGRVAVGVDNVNFLFAKTGGNLTSPVAFAGQGVGAFTLTPNQMPAHNHALPPLAMSVSIPAYAGADADQSVPSSSVVLGVGSYSDGISSAPVNIYSTQASDVNINASGQTSSGATTGTSGQGAQVAVPVNLSSAGGTATTVQPWAALTYIICVNGYYPPRP